MRILLWHGYLLGGTGSNVYTRALAREWTRAGHDVTVLSQEPHPELYDLGGAKSVRPDVGGLLPVFVLDRYEGYEVKLVQECSRAELDDWVERNAAAVRELLPADLVFANHVLLGGPVGAATGARFGVKAHGSELEYSMRGNAELSAWGREALERAEAVFVGSAHIREVLEDVVGHVDRVHEVPPGVDIDEWRPRPRDEALAGLLEEARRDAANPGNASERLPDEGNAERLAEFLAGDRPTVVYFGKLLYNKGVHVLLEALRDLDARAVIVGFGDYREELERARRPEHALHRPVRAPAPRSPAGARGRHGRPLDLPRGVRDGRRRGRRRRLAARSSRATPAWRRSRRAWSRSTRRTCGTLRASRPATRRISRASSRSCWRSTAPDRDRGASGCPERDRHALELGGRRAPPAGTVQLPSRRMGDEQRLGYEELLAASREGFETGTDFTVAVEEEFALLDPATLNLVNRFEEVQAASKGTPLEPHVVGELIASEVEVKTGRCQTFADIPAAMTERRAQLQAVVDPLGIALGATGTHPWSPWQEQRIIDTPHYRRNDELLRYVVWRNNSFGLHVHVGIRGADRAIAVTNGLRNLLPEILALSASSPFHENVNTGLHSARTQIFTRFFPRCGVPDAFASWQQYEDYVRFLYETGSVTEHTQLWWSVRPHLAFPTVEIRIADGQPDLAEAQALAAFATALAARIARAHDEGEPLADQPHRLIEENMWRAIRWGLSGDFLDLERGDVLPTRARLERLLEWIGPVADEIGAGPYLALPEKNAAERQIARFEEGASLEEIYAEQVVGIPVRG